MISPVNPKLECFIIEVLRNDLWKKVCHPHAPNVTYKFFTYNDADAWVRRNLDDFVYEVKQKTLTYDHRTGSWH